MFYLGYLRSELLRRRSRTILTLLGLAVAVALVIAISSLSRGLDEAQSAALDPLSSIGTDLTLTLTPDENASAGFGPGGAAGGRQVVQANQSAITDLSKLGKPGEKFVHDFFLPGTQLTFSQAEAEAVATIEGVQSVASGLLLTAVHQEGTVPKIVTEIQTGGEEVAVDQAIEPPSAAEFAKMRECLQEAGVELPSPGGGAAPGGGAPNSLGPGQSPGQSPGAGGGGFALDTAKARACLPEQFRRFRGTFTTPEETLRQVVDPPQTDIESTSYSIGGVDPRRPEIGLVTPALVAKGRFLSANGGKEALLAESYASRQGLAVGSKLDLNGTRFTVVGLVRPPLGGQTADVYLPLGQLQKLSSQEGLVNVVLVRTADAEAVGEVQTAIETQFPNAQVASAREVADRISGSLVEASDLSARLATALVVLTALAAFLLAALLTLASVGKRVRELGTLKALGWTQPLVVRQVVGESFAQGVAGGLLGVVLGLAAAAAIGAFGPTLTASATTGGEGSDVFGLGELTARTVSSEVALTAPVAPGILAIGFALALAGGLIAGAAGALRASRLRPADALRNVE